MTDPTPARRWRTRRRTGLIVSGRKNYFVHKLICKGTVEERIQKMQAKKGGLAEGLLSGAGARAH